MPKKRDQLMTIRIPAEEKITLQGIADHLDVTLSDVVIKGLRDFLDAGRPLSKGDFVSPKLSGEMMSLRIPDDEKTQLQGIATGAGVTLSKVVVRGILDFITSQSDLITRLEASGALQQLRDELQEKKKTRTRWSA
jgi:predicted transcriptional regulator